VQQKALVSAPLGGKLGVQAARRYTRPYARPAQPSQEFAAAQFLIDSGFRPTEANGMVRHIHTGKGLGRTLSSVWRAMHILLDSADPDSTV